MNLVSDSERLCDPRCARGLRALLALLPYGIVHLFGGVDDGRELFNYKKGSRLSKRDRHLLPVIGCTTQIG